MSKADKDAVIAAHRADFDKHVAAARARYAGRGCSPIWPGFTVRAVGDLERAGDYRAAIPVLLAIRGRMSRMFRVGPLKAGDLRSRNRDEIFVHVEADLAIVDAQRVVYSELDFPVIELAVALDAWLEISAAERPWFAFESMSFEDPGSVRIRQRGEGWCVGSIFEPEQWTAAATLESVDREIRQFVGALEEPFERLVPVGYRSLFTTSQGAADECG